MKLFISIALISIFTIQNCIKTAIVLDYCLNKNFITQNFCENKNKPQMHCEGNCHLNKELKKEEEKEQKIPGFVIEKIEISNKTETDFYKFIFGSIPISHTESYLIKPYYAELTNVFHPPPVILLTNNSIILKEKSLS